MPNLAIEDLTPQQEADFRNAIGITAATVPNTPAGNLAATTVQAAINELDAEKAPASGISPAAILGTAVVNADARLTDERVPTAAGLTTKFATVKATLVDADRVAIFDSAASFVPKHSLFSLVKSTLKTYFDTIYAAAAAYARTDIGQTFAGVQSFTTRPRSSAAITPANATELITQADMLPEFLQFIPTTLPFATTTGTANTNGTNTGDSAVITVLNTAVAGNYREAVCSSIPIHRSGSGANIRFSDSKFTILLDLQTNGTWNNQYGFMFGVGSIQTLSAAGIGVEWTGPTSGFIQIHDGTALYTQAFTVSGFDSSKLHKFALIWDQGTLKLFWKGWNDYLVEPRFALIATLTRTGLPTVTSGVNCKFVNWVTATPGSAMSLNIREAKFLSMAPTLA
jgi:hypothetical protein